MISKTLWCAVLVAVTIATATDIARSDDSLKINQQVYEEFAHLADELGLSLQRSVTWKGLSANSQFDRLANLTKSNVAVCVIYIGNVKTTKFERYVAGFSTYKLSPSEYARFVKFLLLLRQNGSVTTNDIENIITPPLHVIPDTIYDNYQQDDIRDLIKTLLELPDLDDWARDWLIYESDHGGILNRISIKLRNLYHIILIEFGY